MPQKPTKIATMRRCPMGSPNNTAPASVTVKGSNCKRATTFASGILNNAVRKNMVAIISKSERKAIHRRSGEGTDTRHCPSHQSAKAINRLDRTPRKTNSWKKGMAPCVALIHASLTVKANMLIIISRAPRALSVKRSSTLGSHFIGGTKIILHRFC